MCGTVCGTVGGHDVALWHWARGQRHQTVCVCVCVGPVRDGRRDAQRWPTDGLSSGVRGGRLPSNRKDASSIPRSVEVSLSKAPDPNRSRRSWLSPDVCVVDPPLVYECVNEQL